jgi:hypothetical protein
VFVSRPDPISGVLQSSELNNPNEFPLKVCSITPARGEQDGLFLFVLSHPDGVHTGVPIPTFSEYVAMREGVLSPTRPPLKGMPRINTLPTTDAHRKRLHPKPVKVVNMLKPTVRHVAEIVPQNIIPKLKPTRPR